MSLRGAGSQHRRAATSIIASQQAGVLVAAKLPRPLSYVDKALLGSIRSSGKPASHPWRCTLCIQAFDCLCLASASMWGLTVTDRLIDVRVCTIWRRSDSVWCLWFMHDRNGYQLPNFNSMLDGHLASTACIKQSSVDCNSLPRRYPHMQRNMSTAAEKHADLFTAFASMTQRVVSPNPVHEADSRSSVAVPKFASPKLRSEVDARWRGTSVVRHCCALSALFFGLVLQSRWTTRWNHRSRWLSSICRVWIKAGFFVVGVGYANLLALRIEDVLPDNCESTSFSRTSQQYSRLA